MKVSGLRSPSAHSTGQQGLLVDSMAPRDLEERVGIRFTEGLAKCNDKKGKGWEVSPLLPCPTCRSSLSELRESL